MVKLPSTGGPEGCVYDHRSKYEGTRRKKQADQGPFIFARACFRNLGVILIFLAVKVLKVSALLCVSFTPMLPTRFNCDADWRLSNKPHSGASAANRRWST